MRTGEVLLYELGAIAIQNGITEQGYDFCLRREIIFIFAVILFLLFLYFVGSCF